MFTHTSTPLFLLLLLTSTLTPTTSGSALPLALSPRQDNNNGILGRPCTPGTTTCQGGAQCYAVNSMLIPTCGNFAASCSSSAQCATNTCVNGACNGPVAPVLPLGSMCYESAQCEGGAQCYAVNSMLIPACGNFQAQCVMDAQCAFNTCVGGFCNGQPVSSSSSASVAPTTSVVQTSASTTVSTSATSMPTISSSGLTSSPSSSGIVPPTSVPTGGSTTTVTTFTTTTSCPSVSTTVPPPTGTGYSSAIGNSTMPTTAGPSPTLFQGAGEQLRAGVGSIIVAAALSFALMIGA